jgi:hypothetical protein
LSQYRIIRGIQHINVPNNGIYQRILELYIPIPNNLLTGGGNALNMLAFPPGPATPPTIVYREGFISGPFIGTKQYNAIPPDPALGDPLSVQLNIDYNYSNLAAGLIQGRVNFMRLRENTPINPELRIVSNLEFSIEYIPQE